MKRTLVRRATAVAAVLAAVTGATLAGPAPAAVAAAGSRAQFFVETGFSRTVPVRTGGNGEQFRALSLDIIGLGHRELDQVRVTVDASGIKGVGELAQPARGCAWTRADHLHETCALGDLPKGFAHFEVGVRATASAKVARSGQVIFKVTSSNASDVSGGGPHQVGVTVADGPDIAVRNLGERYRVRAGADDALPITITNVGSKDATDPVVFIHDQFGLMSLLGNHSNCVYTSDAGKRTGIFCEFQGFTLKPGQTASLSDPFTLAVPKHGLGDQIQYGADLAGSSWVGTPSGTPGTGAPVTLVLGGTPAGAVVPRHATATADGDIDPYNGLYYTDLDTGYSAALAAVTSSVHTLTGHAATITLGVKNIGTQAFTKKVQIGPSQHGTVGAYLYVPAGVTVLSLPKGCQAEQSGPDAAHAAVRQSLGYSCVTTAPLAPGHTFTWKITVRAARPVTAAPFEVVALGQESPTADFAAGFRWATFTATRPRHRA